MRRIFLILGAISLLLIAAALFLAYQAWQEFEAGRAVLPAGSTAAGVPVGGLTRAGAAARLEAAYERPVLLDYAGAVFQITPDQAGFELDLDAMLPPEDPPLGETGYWDEFRSYLWGERRPPVKTDLAAHHDPDRVRAFLEEAAARYDRPALAPAPIPASTHYRPGQSGQALDVDAAEEPVGEAFYRLDERRVALPVRAVPLPPPEWENLRIQLEQLLKTSGFDGLAAVYVHDLQQNRTLYFAYHGNPPPGTEMMPPVPPEIAFTASSIIKIPILVSAFRRLDGPPTDLQNGWFVEMMTHSSNPAADAVMKWILDEVRGPLVVTEDLRELGFENTFTAGYFELGAPLLAIYETPANTRPDLDTQPDLYNQAAPGELGKLLTGIYQCSEAGRGLLVDTFPGEITQDECKQIIEYMRMDRQAYLLTAGLPDGTYIAHKHGYGSTFTGTINTIGDAGLIFTPGGDYAMVVYLNRPELLVWDPANELTARLSQAVYNFFNVGEGELAGN